MTDQAEAGPSFTFFERQMAMYTTFHRDPRNRATHFVGVPVIVISLLVAFSTLRFELLGFEMSAGELLAAAVLALWVVLDKLLGFLLAAFMLPSALLAKWLVLSHGPAVVWTVFGILFVGGWALQFWGHYYEGRRQALISNLFQALVAPMFLVAELLFMAGFRLDLQERIEAAIDELFPDYARD